MRILFILLLVITACGKKLKTPRNIATPEQKVAIKETLNELQKEFSDLGIKVNIRKHPVIVSHLKNAWGECVIQGKKKYIAIDPKVFEYTTRPESMTEDPLSHILLHEIGHCYFNRKHDSALIGEEHAQFRAIWPFENERIILVGKSIPASVMLPGAALSTIKPMRKYYVAEVARRTRAHVYEDLLPFLDFEIVRPSEL